MQPFFRRFVLSILDPSGTFGRQARPRFAACAALVVLAGCGGEGEPEPPLPKASVEVADCKNTTVHDSGHAMYVVLGRDCPAGEGDVHRVRLATEDPAKPPTPFTQSMDLREGEEGATVTIPRLGTRTVSLFRQGTWRMLPNTESWSGRDGSGLLMFNGELYLLGGWMYGPLTSEVWKTRDLVNWDFVTTAPWPGRHGAGWVVHDGRMYVISGEVMNDVWSSGDGVEWVQENASAPFGKRYAPNAASVGGYLVVYAGLYWHKTFVSCDELPYCGARGLRDVWRSRDGREWELVNEMAPWEGRALIHGSAVHDGEIYLIGGGLKVAGPGERYSETNAEFTDIWSSPDGATWTRRTEKFSFTPRTHFSVVSTPKGCFVSDGSVGTQNNLSNDLFHAPDCVNFEPVPDTPPFEKRHASSLAYFNGSIVILGGPDTYDPGTKVWQYFP